MKPKEKSKKKSPDAGTSEDQGRSKAQQTPLLYIKPKRKKTTKSTAAEDLVYDAELERLIAVWKHRGKHESE